jgi:regulatory protein YycI of two-component signal transduction system YycFG
MQPETQVPRTVHSGFPRIASGSKASATSSVFIPTLLMALAFVAWLAFQATQQLTERQQLAVAQTNLEPQEQAATKLRASLDAIAVATAKLAADGNANARAIVEELRKRGVTINADAASKPR